MKAVTWQGKRDVRVETVPDPTIEQSNDAIIRVTTSGLCGSDLHLYDVLSPFMTPGDVLGHEPLGVVEEVGSAITHLEVGDRVVTPFQISCGSCWMCQRGLQTQCEVTQMRETGMGAALFGFSSLYGAVPGAQAEYLRIPHADYNPIKIPDGMSDERFIYLSDVLPTAWQSVEYAQVRTDDTLAIVGLGPIGQMAARIALNRGIRVIGLDVDADRLARARALGVETIDPEGDDPVGAVKALTQGRGADGVIDAVGMEAHGSLIPKLAQMLAGAVPKPLGRAIMSHASVDRMAAIYLAIDLVRRGGTVSLIGLYAGTSDPMPMQTLFDRQITLRMGQANCKRWVDDIWPLISGADDKLGVEGFASHRMSLEQAPEAYKMFQEKTGDAIKILFKP